jgi:hypothetical protein
MPFEEQLPQWDAPGVEPPASKKSTGWQAGEKPPADYWNWQMNRTYKALEELQQKAAEIADLNAHTAATTGVHGATSTATPNTLVQRDSAGRFKASAPVAADDVVRKAETDAAMAAAQAAQSSINTHAARTDNPHGTTASQVGAPSLTTIIPDGVSLNTALTSGFYRLGVDHADAPEDADYGQMIVSRGGDTVFQIVSGFNTNQYYMRQGNPPEAGGEGVWQPWRRLWHDGNNPALIAPNGYQRLASGLILQWGYVVANSGESVTVYFPIVFPNTVAAVYASLDSSDPASVTTSGLGNNRVNLKHNAQGSKHIFYLAIGW